MVTVLVMVTVAMLTRIIVAWPVFMILVTVMTMLRELMQAIVITKAQVMRTAMISPFSKPL